LKNGKEANRRIHSRAGVYLLPGPTGIGTMQA